MYAIRSYYVLIYPAAYWKDMMNLQQKYQSNRIQELTYWGIRASVGVIFFVYGIQKFDPIWKQHLINFGLPPELQIPIALRNNFV